MLFCTFDPPRFGNGIHWRALAILLIPPALGLGIRFVAGPMDWWAWFLVLMLALPFSVMAAWKYSCYVAETHAQPWGYISFLAFLGSCWVWWLSLGGWWWVR
jgi:hypothetical protein